MVSAHGRPLAQAAAAVATATKAAVLMSPDSPPEALGKELLAIGAAPAAIRICSRLGLPGESVTSTDVAGLANHTWDPLSVVVVLRGDPVAPAPQLTWGRPEAAFAHRGGMITKAEVRSVALARLDLPDTGVLWDVGAGSGSVAIEAALLAPGLQVFAVERRPDDARRIETNARRLRAAVTVIEAAAPAALAALPDPDRVFVGGGGPEVLDAVLARLRPGGAVVATFAALDRAAVAAERLGHVVQVAISRGERLAAGGWRLAAENPVFVAWGSRS